MKTKLSIGSVAVSLLFSCLAYAIDIDKNTSVYFSPKGGATDAIVKEIKGARKEILVQAYSFTSEPIVNALIQAEINGIKVQCVLDKSNKHGNGARIQNVSDAKILTYVDSKHQIAHNKIMIIDGKEVITGSFNFTNNAENNNAENCIIIQSEDLAKVYIQNWKNHLAHSEEYQKE